MFTVKATYRGEIRKFSFPQCSTFPSFDQLYNQLYRVFPISHNYFLSKLLFSPDSSQPSRILIGREVHSAEEYQQCLLPFEGRTWSSALLRFSVFDETPHKVSSVLSGDQSYSASVLSDSNTAQRNTQSDVGSPLAGASCSAQPKARSAPISLFHVPPPPIIFSSSPVASQASMDVDSDPFNCSSKTSPSLPQHPSSKHSSTPSKSGSCCAVSQGKEEIHTLLSKFKVDLDRVLAGTFGSSPLPLPPLASTTTNSSFATPLAPPMLCSSCSNDIRSQFFSCVNCVHVLCIGCHERCEPNYCAAVLGSHIMQLKFPDNFFRTSASSYPQAPVSASIPSWPVHLTFPNSQPGMGPPFWASAYAPSTSYNSMVHPMYYGSPTPVIPFIPPFSAFSPAKNLHESSDELQAPSTVRGPSPMPVPAATTSLPVVTPPPPPVIHPGVICDTCEKIIEGIRHKCLDCRDYDLCTACIQSGCAERHNSFHEFLEIDEPGRIVVHTVYSGNRDANEAPNSNDLHTSVSPVVPFAEPVLHHATCDLCDSRIRGDRYKCVNCPDFDTCGSCYSIVSEQHPHHAFVKISIPADYISRDSRTHVMHSAICDGCNKTIFGVRYKCMHPDCPDFDLCEGCEAHPIPMHPNNHPLLKMKFIDTVVPTVYRVGQTTLIGEVKSPRGRSPISRIVTSEAARRSRSRSYSFDRGYMRNPSTVTAQRGASPGPSPPSPFFFHSESSRSKSRSPIVLTNHYEDNYSCAAPQPIIASRRFSPPLSPTPNLRILSRSPSPIPVITRSSGGHSISHEDVPVPAQSSMNSRSTSPSFWRPGTTTRRSPPPAPLITGFTFDELHTDNRSPLSKSISTEEVFSTQSIEHIETPPWPYNFGRHVPATHSSPTEHDELEVSEIVVAPAASESSSPPATHDQPEEVELWPGSCQELKHLMQGPSLPATTFDDLSSFGTPTSVNQDTTESPLTGEALLNRPSVTPVGSQDGYVASRSLAALLNDYPSLKMVSSLVASTIKGHNEDKPLPEVSRPLSSNFISDVTVPDGQIFPPGAEFMKCWRLINNGDRDWPESTELVFVAGESLVRDTSISQSVKVGFVKAGAEVELWTGELKAPDKPGRYVGYWGLRDDVGRLFGNSIWIDINVAETSHHSRHSPDESLASSSIIIMPQSAFAQSSMSVAGLKSNRGTTSTIIDSPLTALSKNSSDDAISDDGSDISSVSLISVPTSEDDDDEALFRDSRLTEHARQSMEYVLLYDDHSSDDEAL